MSTKHIRNSCNTCALPRINPHNPKAKCHIKRPTSYLEHIIVLHHDMINTPIILLAYTHNHNHNHKITLLELSSRIPHVQCETEVPYCPSHYVVILKTTPNKSSHT